MDRRVLSSDSHMANDKEEAEKAYRLAEERFLAGDVAGALRTARNARRLFPTVPALQNAAAAYDVHAAACAVARGGRRWYAVLGLQPEEAVVTHEDVKKQYRRLCLVLHPDKNRSAAADGAFRLLQQAWEVLSDRHPPPGPASAAKPSGRTYAPPPPPPPQPRYDPRWEKADRYGRWTPPSDWSSFGFRKPPEPDGSTFDFKAWRAAYARAHGTTYCGHCDSESAGDHGGKPREKCHACGARFSPPRRDGATTPAGTGDEPPPAPRQRKGGAFTCPTACPRCGTRFSSTVSVGLCKLRCQACSYDATVDVCSRDTATAF